MDSDDIISWFIRDGIAYPWGRDTDPYRVWISEIMLQQTVVSAVIPFFEKWMARFPSLDTLAGAGEGDVLRLWEGLGYYSRARNIHSTAQRIAAAGGVFPSSYEELIALPGIGDYTACAILSISFKQVLPVMDANVRRICQRYRCQKEWNSQIEKDWKKTLTHVMDKNNPGIFNCGLMQLGQIVCRRSRPVCDNCPIKRECCAYRENLTQEIPLKKKRVIIEKKSQVLILKKEEYQRTLYWIIQRKAGIGRGLWSFPRVSENENFTSAWVITQTLTTRVHLYTKYRERLIPNVYEQKKPRKELKNGTSNLPPIAIEEGEGFWATAGELKNLAVPAVYRKIIDELITLPE